MANFSDEEINLMNEIKRLRPELGPDEQRVVDYILAEGITLEELRHTVELICGIVMAKMVH